MKLTTLLRSSLALAVLTLAVGARSEEIRIGGLVGNDAVFTGSPATLIDWSSPATATGKVNTASVAWHGATAPCEGIFYVRFYNIPSNAFAIVMTAERGPFRAVTGINTVALEPAVDVTPDTYIGIHRGAGPESCGQPYGTFTREPGRVLFTSEDFKGGAFTSLSPAPNFRLQAQASSAPSVRVSTIPAVGSAAGNNGSFFRTALTIANPSALEVRGKLVMRLAGREGSDADPSLEFVVPARGSANYADVVATMGQAGLGSLDVYTTASPRPIVTARVFNDLGELGTSGLFEEAVPAGSTYLSVANVLVPEDLTHYRLNIGIRTITAVDVRIEIFDAAGANVGTSFRSYPANFFQQISAAEFTGGPVPAGGRIVASAFQKEFIVYGAVTDNRTNDPSVRVGLD